MSPRLEFKSAPRWLDEPIVLAIHGLQLAEHGGLDGVRDPALLESAIARPENLFAYESPDAAACAASYGFGIARNHPFIDGNKRTAFVAMELFLLQSGFELIASDESAVLTTLALAAGELQEAALADWLRANSRPV